MEQGRDFLLNKKLRERLRDIRGVVRLVREASPGNGAGKQAA